MVEPREVANQTMLNIFLSNRDNTNVLPCTALFISCSTEKRISTFQPLFSFFVKINYASVDVVYAFFCHTPAVETEVCVFWTHTHPTPSSGISSDTVFTHEPEDSQRMFRPPDAVPQVPRAGGCKIVCRFVSLRCLQGTLQPLIGGNPDWVEQ